jgi:hypothetical protein
MLYLPQCNMSERSPSMAEAGPKAKSTAANGASVPLEDADLRAGIQAARQAEDLTKAPGKRRAAKPKTANASKTRTARAKKPAAASKPAAKRAKAKPVSAKAAAAKTPKQTEAAVPPMAAMPAPSASAPWVPAKAGLTAAVAPISAASREWMRMAQATPTTAVRNAGDLSLTLLDFVGANTNAAFSALHAMAGAGSVGEAVEIQRNYAEEAMATAREQMAELKEKSAEILSETRTEFAPKAWFSWDRS